MSVAADPGWNLKLIEQVGGWCWAVDVIGGKAYVGEGPNLTILDVAVPTSPVPIGRFSFGTFFVTDIQVTNGYAYVTGFDEVAGDHGLQILDVTNPHSPRFCSFYPTPSPGQGVFVRDGLAFVACGTNASQVPGGLMIINVSDASSPTLRGCFLTPLFVAAFNVHVRSDTAYVAAMDGLHIIDVTNPSLPTELAQYGRQWYNDVFVANGLAYTATDGGLGIIDVTSPTAPTLRGGLGASQSYGISLSNGLVFLAQLYNGPTRPNGLAIIDVTNPSSPTLLASMPMPGRAESVAVSGGTAYLANGPGGCSLLDISMPSSPTLHATYDTLSDPRDVHVAAGVAYVANGVRGLKTLDVSNPRAPKVLGSLATPSEATKVSVAGSTAYVSGFPQFGGGPGFFQIVDITTASSPKLLGSYHGPRPNDASVAGGLAYITDSYVGLNIVDVTDPSSPALVGSFETPSLAYGVAVSGDLAFIADYTSLQVVDVSDTDAPVFRSSFPGFRITDVSVSNGVAYLTGSWSQADFVSLDVTDPDIPRLLGAFDIPGYSYEAGGLYVSNGLAYALLDGVRILDVSEPASPTSRGFYRWVPSIFGSDIFAHGNLVYFADYAGLRILEFSDHAAAGGSWPLYE